MEKPILTLTGNELENLACFLYNTPTDEDLEDYDMVRLKGYSIKCDTKTGEYDSGKGALVNFKINLFKDGTLVGETIGGYYNQGDFSFSESKYEFSPITPKFPKAQTIFSKEDLRKAYNAGCPITFSDAGVTMEGVDFDAWYERVYLKK